MYYATIFINMYFSLQISHNYIKYLGVIFGQHLRLNIHVLKLDLKLCKLRAIYNNIKQFLNN